MDNPQPLLEQRQLGVAATGDSRSADVFRPCPGLEQFEKFVLVLSNRLPDLLVHRPWLCPHAQPARNGGDTDAE